MLTVAELNAIRDRVRKQLSIREPHDRLIIGVGTVGIAAGAREVMAAAMQEVSERNLDMVVVGEDLAVSADQMPVVKFVPEPAVLPPVVKRCKKLCMEH